MRAPVLALSALSTLLLAALPARADVVVTSCAEVGAGVEVGADTAFAIELHRDPAQASAARLDFMAYDPDNLNGVVEVDVTLAPAGYAVPPFTRLTLGNGGSAFDSRSVSYSVDLPTTALVQGANTVVFDDNDGVSVFTVERLCLTLIGAPPSPDPPERETFCADDVYGPDPTVNNATFNDGSSAAPGANARFDVDVPLGDEARVGLDLVAFVDSGDSGAHVAGFTNGAVSLTQAFNADNGAKDDQYRVVRAPEVTGLLTGGSADQPTTNVLEVEGDFEGHLWLACLDVEGAFVPPEVDAGPPDAGPPVDEDAGDPLPGRDAGPPVGDDAGAPAPPDAGPPLGEDAGELLPPADAGEEPRDANDPVPNPPLDDERAARAELMDPSFRVASTCASVRASDALPFTLVALLTLGLRRRARRRT